VSFSFLFLNMVVAGGVLSFLPRAEDVEDERTEKKVLLAGRVEIEVGAQRRARQLTTAA
jgi:hypothetical protein